MLTELNLYLQHRSHLVHHIPFVFIHIGCEFTDRLKRKCMKRQSAEIIHRILEFGKFDIDGKEALSGRRQKGKKQLQFI